MFRQRGCCFSFQFGFWEIFEELFLKSIDEMRLWTERAIVFSPEDWKHVQLTFKVARWTWSFKNALWHNAMIILPYNLPRGTCYKVQVHLITAFKSAGRLSYSRITVTPDLTTKFAVAWSRLMCYCCLTSTDSCSDIRKKTNNIAFPLPHSYWLLLETSIRPALIVQPPL